MTPHTNLVLKGQLIVIFNDSFVPCPTVPSDRDLSVQQEGWLYWQLKLHPVHMSNLLTYTIQNLYICGGGADATVYMHRPCAGSPVLSPVAVCSHLSELPIQYIKKHTIISYTATMKAQAELQYLSLLARDA